MEPDSLKRKEKKTTKAMTDILNILNDMHSIAFYPLLKLKVNS